MIEVKEFLEYMSSGKKIIAGDEIHECMLFSCNTRVT